MKNRWFEILANLLFWIISAWLIISGFSVESRDIQIINDVETIRISHNESIIRQMVICILLSVCLFYLNIWNINSFSEGRKKNTVILKSILAFGVTLAFNELFLLSGIIPAQPRLPFILNAGVVVFYFTVSLSYGVIKVWQQAEKQKQKLLLEKKQAELNLLRSQLHPHFLFNVLNNLLAMVDQQKNPVLAGSIDRLSGLLRYVVYEVAANEVPVRKEIEFIHNYAELQMLRFEKNEVDFAIEVMGDHDQQHIEPGIFISFIENAFKYGVEPEKKSCIKVVFDLTKTNRIGFEITNPVLNNYRSKENIGTGINSVRERLKLVYPGCHQLTTTEDGQFTVKLEIGTHESNNHR